MGIHAVSFQLLFLSSSSAFSFSKAFSFLPSELFLSDHTYIHSISLPFLSSILFSLSLSSFFIFLLWFSCGLLSIQTGLHAILSLTYFFYLSAQSFLSFTVDILQQVVISFFSSLQLCFCYKDIHWDWLACTSEHTLKTGGQADTLERVRTCSPLPIHRSENLLKAYCCCCCILLCCPLTHVLVSLGLYFPQLYC